jgi:hypothetical protein
MTKKRIFLLVVLALVLSTGCGFAGAKTPGQRVLEAVELICDGKPNQLDDYVLREDIPGKGFLYAMMSAAFSEKGGVSRLAVESEKIDGESASVKIRWHYKNGGSAHESFPVRREDGKWRINL